MKNFKNFGDFNISENKRADKRKLKIKNKTQKYIHEVWTFSGTFDGKDFTLDIEIDNNVYDDVWEDSIYGSSITDEEKEIIFDLCLDEIEK